MKTRKLFVVALALVLTLCMTATAFADAKVETIPNRQDIDVTGTYSDTHTSGTVYSVDISWGEMKFTYSIAGTATWQPDSHTYNTSGENAGWVATGNTITTVNHSNKAVNVAFAFVNDTTNAPTVTGSFDNGDSLNDPDKAPTNSSTLTIGGTLDPDKKDVKIGTVTITLS